MNSTDAAKQKLDPNAKVRNRGDVVFPAGSKKVKDNKDHFPINSVNQARNALSRVAQYNAAPSWYSGSLSDLQKKVRSAVKRKYPQIEVTTPKKSKGSYLAMLAAELNETGVDAHWSEYAYAHTLPEK